MTHTTTCKFCSSEITMDFCDYGLSLFPGLNAWFHSIACSRCADYNRSVRKLHDEICSHCQQLIAARQVGHKKLEQIERMKRELLIVLTRKLSSAHARHHHKPDPWTADFVDILLDQPERAWQALGFFQKSFKS